MTRIVETELLSQKAVLEVCRVINSAGAVAEVVKNDFGEDLIVQSQVNNEADNFSILVQVKGTRLVRKGSWLSFRVSVEHLLRWVSHYQSVLVCIYDDNSRNIYSFVPRSKFSLWELSTTNKNTLTIKLCEDDIFCAETADRFIWNCRINYFQRMINWYDDMRRDVLNFSDDRKSRLENIDRERGIVAFSFLKSINLIQDGEIDSSFVASVKNGSENFAAMNNEAGERLGVSELFCLCLLAHVERVAKQGLPSALLLFCSEVASAYFMKLYPDLWRELSARLGPRS